METVNSKLWDTCSLELATGEAIVIGKVTEVGKAVEIGEATGRGEATNKVSQSCYGKSQ